MQTQKAVESQQPLMRSGQVSGSLNFNGVLAKEDEEMSKSALSTFKAKEEEIEKKKMEVTEKVPRRLATIREMFRIKDPKVSLDFYSRILGMSKGYTLLINTWKRYDILKLSASHYASCPGLDSIHDVWSEPDPPSEPLIDFLMNAIKLNSKEGQEIELKFDINKEDSLNNIFKEIKGLKSDVVFSIDDDVIFPCKTVEFGFRVWQSALDAML